MPDLPDSLTRIHPLGFTNLVEVKKLYPLPGTSPTLPRDQLTEQPEFLSATDGSIDSGHRICVDRVPRRASSRWGTGTHFTSTDMTELNCLKLYMSINTLGVKRPLLVEQRVERWLQEAQLLQTIHL